MRQLQLKKCSEEVAQFRRKDAGKDGGRSLLFQDGGAFLFGKNADSSLRSAAALAAGISTWRTTWSRS